MIICLRDELLSRTRSCQTIRSGDNPSLGNVDVAPHWLHDTTLHSTFHYQIRARHRTQEHIFSTEIRKIILELQRLLIITNLMCFYIRNKDRRKTTIHKRQLVVQLFILCTVFSSPFFSLAVRVYSCMSSVAKTHTLL